MDYKEIRRRYREEFLMVIEKDKEIIAKRKERERNCVKREGNLQG